MLLGFLGRAFPSGKPTPVPVCSLPPKLPGPTGGLGGVTLSFRDRDRGRGRAVIVELLRMETTVQLPLVMCCAGACPNPFPSRAGLESPK